MPSRTRTEVVVLDRDHIESMAAVVDEVVDRADAPARGVPLSYLSAITPFDDPILSQLDESADFPFATTAEDHVSARRTLHAGERLTAVLSFDGVVTRDRPAGGRVAFVTFRRAFLDTDGGEVAVVRWVCALMDRPAEAGSSSEDHVVPSPRSRRFSSSLAHRWAAWTDDHEPIHLDPATARRAGLPGPVAHASLVTAVADRLADHVLGPGRPRGFALRHRGGVFFGDSIGVQESDDGLLIISERGTVARLVIDSVHSTRPTRQGAHT